jgi:hypothetical protein
VNLATVLVWVLMSTYDGRTTYLQTADLESCQRMQAAFIEANNKGKFFGFSKCVEIRVAADKAIYK